MTAIWNNPGIRARVRTEGRHGVGTILRGESIVFETRGNQSGIGDEWDDEKQAVVDLAVILCLETYAMGEIEFSRYIAAGFNTAEVEKIKKVSELEKWAGLIDYEIKHPDQYAEAVKVDDGGQGLLF